jgi:hypothetical protein
VHLIGYFYSCITMLGFMNVKLMLLTLRKKWNPYLVKVTDCVINESYWQHNKFCRYLNRSCLLGTLKKNTRQISHKNINLSSARKCYLYQSLFKGIHYNKLCHSLGNVYKCELKNISQVSWRKFLSLLCKLYKCNKNILHAIHSQI